MRRGGEGKGGKKKGEVLRYLFGGTRDRRNLTKYRDEISGERKGRSIDSEYSSFECIYWNA